MAQRANNAYYRDPDVARGFNNLSSAILGSASGDAAYELARKRRAEAVAANLKNADIATLERVKQCLAYLSIKKTDIRIKLIKFEFIYTLTI